MPTTHELAGLTFPLRTLKQNPKYLSGFQVVSPRFRSTQADLFKWLTAAHARSGALSRDVLGKLFERYGASSEQIAFRGHELADLTHERWDEMRLFGGPHSTIREKTKFFDDVMDSVFEKFYPAESTPPRELIHVTCTGYSAPSGAQRLVSSRHWGENTQESHAYHMGCYAAHPALRMAAGLLSSSKDSEHSVDIVHTEMCSLHLDPADHDPAQLVIQSLFADGFIKYQMGSMSDAQKKKRGEAVLELLVTRDMIVPESTSAMRWATGPFIFDMTLSKEVPVLLASALPRFAASLFHEAGLDFVEEKASAVFAIHPGGPRIIELSEKILGLHPDQADWSRAVLREHGNMSSATLPHVWQKLLGDEEVSDGTLVVSLGAGPGLTLSGALFRKRIL